MASANVLELTSTNFQSKVLDAKGTVLVDFWAEWCGPCKMIAPLLDQIADANPGKVTIGKVDVDKSSDLASRYNIRAIPTMIVFHDGQIKEQIVGMTSKGQLGAETRSGLIPRVWHRQDVLAARRASVADLVEACPGPAARATAF